MISQCGMSVLKENSIMSIKAWRAAEDLAAGSVSIRALAWLFVLTFFSNICESSDCRGVLTLSSWECRTQA